MMCLIKITLHSPVATKLDNNAVKKAHIKELVINGRVCICLRRVSEGFVGWQNNHSGFWLAFAESKHVSGEDMKSKYIHENFNFFWGLKPWAILHIVVLKSFKSKILKNPVQVVSSIRYPEWRQNSIRLIVIQYLWLNFDKPLDLPLLGLWGKDSRSIG